MDQKAGRVGDGKFRLADATSAAFNTRPGFFRGGVFRFFVSSQPFFSPPHSVRFLFAYQHPLQLSCEWWCFFFFLKKIDPSYERVIYFLFLPLKGVRSGGRPEHLKHSTANSNVCLFSFFFTHFFIFLVTSHLMR